MMKILTIVALIFALNANAAVKEPVDYVDPLLGTSSSRWMLFPGPAMPFGMVKLSPNNTDDTGYQLGAGYEYKINSISGFGHVHSWMMGSFLTMPATGTLKILPGTKDDPDSGYRSRINHDNEKASPGYYSVLLDDYGIRAELTSTTRGGFQRFTFPKEESGHILFDLQVPEEEEPTIIEASVKKVSDTEIEGYVKREAGQWNEYTLHFVAKFNRSFYSMGGWQGSVILDESDEIKVRENSDVGVYLKFDLKEDQKVLIKTGISYVSTEQARLNMATEMEGFGWDFDAVHKNARDTWNRLLGKIKVKGGTETDRLKFYTNMYRSYCSRSIFSDVNGKYVDVCENVQQLDNPEVPVYGCDAFWGSFWNLNQHWSLVIPDITQQWVNSLLEIYDKGGWLPDAPGGIEYSSIMVASHQIPFIVNAWQKGIRGFDAEKAYRAMKEIQMNPGRPHECGGYVGNRNLQTYMDIGYVPADEGPVSNTLEYAYDDWCLAQMAKSLGKMDDYKYFMQRARYYRNVFDPSTGYIRPKYAGGPWLEEFTTTEGAAGQGHSFGFGSKDYVEANAWQFSWFAPHDLKGLIDLMGREEFNDRLEEGFSKSRPHFAGEFVNHGNQPNMQAAWLFNYSGKAWLTQYWVREILDNYYGTGPVDGYHGDEDQGQMGAWFVMSAMGLFQMDGGSSVDPVYELSGPLFEKIHIQLDPHFYEGKEFIIEAKNSSAENRFIQSATLNGKELDKFWFRHTDLVRGGKLVLLMGPEPNKEWPSNREHPQLWDIDPFVTAPYIIDTDRLFHKDRLVKMTCDTKDAEIHFTLDGSEPDKNAPLYAEPFVVNKTTMVKMIAYAGDQQSLPSRAEIKKAGVVRPVHMGEVETGLSYKYTHGIYRMVYDFLNEPPLKTGMVPDFTIEPREKEQFFSFEYEGYINIPQDGLYTFYLASNDGGRLYIDGSMLLNNDGLHPLAEVNKSISLTAGLHPVSVKYFQEGGKNGLLVSWEGPGFEKQEIPASVLFHAKQDSTTARAESVDFFPEPKNGNTYVIAHRGVHIGIPENSLPAYRKAIDLGCDFVEIDVRGTKDGRIVSVHNSTIDAYVDGVSGKVSDFTLAELKEFDIGESFGPEWKNTPVPTIEEILQLCRGKIGIYLDLKEDLVQELVKIIKEYDMERDIVWCIPVSRMDAIMKLKKNCDECIPMPDPGPAQNITSVARQVQPLVIAPVMEDFSKEYVKIAHEYDIKVFVDEDRGDEAEWTKILDWGADGIQTDNPQALIRFLSKMENFN